MVYQKSLPALNFDNLDRQNPDLLIRYLSGQYSLQSSYFVLVVVADNTVSALRTTNNLVFASLDAYKTTIQHAKENTKQILDINTKAAKTFEQNSREVARAAQDANARFNASINNNNTNTTTTSTTSVA